MLLTFSAGSVFGYQEVTECHFETGSVLTAVLLG